MWPLFIEFLMSTLWAYAMLFTLIVQSIGFVLADDRIAHLDDLFGWTGLLLAAACLLQLGVAVAMDRRYDVRLMRNLFWIVWYPFVYWMLHMMTTVVAVPTVLFTRRRHRAVWKSPDRGVRHPLANDPAARALITPGGRA
jgi:biofilm PGA synthesis N-glycosyltransferase PgaC